MDLPITLGITIEKVCNTLMEARVQTQLNHWVVKPSNNLALHLALGELYEGLDRMLDSFVESAQGTYGRVFSLNINNISTNSTTPYQQHVVDLREFLIKSRSAIPHSHLQNQIDEFLTLVNQILYKIK